MNRYSTHSSRHHCVFFCHHHLVGTISLVAMQPICDNILKSTLSSSLLPSANEPLWIIKCEMFLQQKSKSPRAIDVDSVSSRDSLSQSEMLEMGKFNNSKNYATAHWSNKFVVPFTLSFGHLFNK